eukprot:2314469-Rhodomonas_salina.1
MRRAACDVRCASMLAGIATLNSQTPSRNLACVSASITNPTRCLMVHRSGSVMQVSDGVGSQARRAHRRGSPVRPRLNPKLSALDLLQPELHTARQSFTEPEPMR